MGISLKRLTEGCCESLNKLSTVDLDAYKSDKCSSSIDRLLECSDKYILIEEKSFLLDYFRLSGQEAKIKFQPIDGRIKVEFLEAIKILSPETKKRIMYEACFSKTLSSSDKIKDTMILLCQDNKFCNEKIKNSQIIYLYCKSNHPVDKLLNIIFNSKKASLKIIECSKLDRYLKSKAC